MKYIFYSVIGRHANETIKEILKRKTEEIEASGFSLWSAKIDKKSMEQAWGLSESDEVFVLCKISTNATDPFDGKKVIVAERMLDKDGEKLIPYGIQTTYGEGKNYQAYVVESYQFLPDNMDFDFGSYECVSSENKTIPFAERFKHTYFQNTFGKINPSIKKKCNKPINVIMKLKYPFVVNIL